MSPDHIRAAAAQQGHSRGARFILDNVRHFVADESIVRCRFGGFVLTEDDRPLLRALLAEIDAARPAPDA